MMSYSNQIAIKCEIRNIRNELVQVKERCEK